MTSLHGIRAATHRWIDNTYEIDKVKKIYILGDGANWIKTGLEWLHGSINVLDKIHLMKAVNGIVGKESKENRKEKKAIYLDEIWRLIGVTSNKEVAGFVYKIFKTIRKFGGSSVAITQDISDLFSLEEGIYGKSILNNSEIKTFFALEEENIILLSKYTNLSEKEKIEIKSLKRGECLMFVGNEHILTKIDAAEYEKNIIEKGL